MKPRPWWLWFGLFGLFAALAVPITISFDGLLYVQSSQAIFTELAFDDFQWTRGPLYPVIIRLVRLAGGTGSVWIVAAQATAAAAAAWVVARALLGRGWGLWLGLALILLNPLTLGYAGSVLQQTWIMVVLSLNAGLVWAAVDRRASVGWLTGGIAALTVGATLLIPQLAYVCAVSAAVVAGVVARQRWAANRAHDDQGKTKSRALVVLGPLGVGLLALLAVVGFSRLIMQPWDSYKDSVLQGSGWNSLGIPTTIPEPSMIDIVVGIPERLPVIIKTASIILDTPLPGAVSTWGGDENEFFGFMPFSPSRRCGVVQYNDVVQRASDATAALVTATCVSKGFQMGINELVPIGRKLHRAASLAFVGALILLPWSARGRRALLLLLPFYAYWAMYSIYGASLDRYGFPLYAGSAALLAFLVLMGADLLGRTAGRVRPDPAAAKNPVGTTTVEG